jgi:hypothetical protein
MGSKRSKGHGQAGRGGWGEEGGSGSGPQRPTGDVIAKVGKLKVGVEKATLVPPHKRRSGQ